MQLSGTRGFHLTKERAIGTRAALKRHQNWAARFSDHA